jgi:Pyruvate/2-oxoacid:ferredoxin oxidoreductase delta subunit
MRISFLTFSLTGNTKLTAKRISSKLTESTPHPIHHFNLVKIGKEVASLGVHSSPLLTSAHESILNSNVIALSCFVNGFHPPHRVNQVFDESIFPSRLFSRMEYFFVFATAGQLFGRTISVLATLLNDKNPRSCYLGSLGILAPYNWPPMQPERPFRDAWRPSELARADDFGTQIAWYLSGTQPIPNLKFSKAYSWGFMTKKGFMRDRMIPYPVCDQEKCVKCGTCAVKCPENAIKINSDIEDGFPVFDSSKCVGCGRCFNKCPSEAIEMPKCHTEVRSRYPKANVVGVGERCSDGMISQPLPSRWELQKRHGIGAPRRSRFSIILWAVIVLLIIWWFFVRSK